MAGTGFHRFFYSFGIPEIIVANRFHILVQFIHQRNTGRDVYFDDIIIGHAIEILKEPLQKPCQFSVHIK